MHFYQFLLIIMVLRISLFTQVKEDAQQLARVFETIGAFKLPRKGGKGKQIFGRQVLSWTIHYLFSLVLGYLLQLTHLHLSFQTPLCTHCNL